MTDPGVEPDPVPDAADRHWTEDEPFDLPSAVRAGEAGLLGFWVGDFLASPGSDNAALAGAFAGRGGCWLGPVRFELARLTPMAGPDGEEVVVPVAEDEWEHDLHRMTDALDHGWHPPPLLVSARDGGYFLEDGNHRHAALRRAGETHGWAVVWFASEDEREAFVTALAADDLPDAVRDLDGGPGAEHSADRPGGQSSR